MNEKKHMTDDCEEEINLKIMEAYNKAMFKEKEEWERLNRIYGNSSQGLLKY